MQPKDRWLDLENIRLHAREWFPQEDDPSKPLVLLYHGLSSNAATWDLVAKHLVQAGYPAIAINQRGHGLSDKPETGYDFGAVAADVRGVVASFAPREVVLAGQSWGGNVLLEVAARYPGLAQGYIFVDGGFLNLRQRGTWEQVSVELRPPESEGLLKAEITHRISQIVPDWGREAIEMTLKNFEHLPDGTVRPWLTLDRHMQILKAIYDQDVEALFPQVEEPVLLCPAGSQNERDGEKSRQVNVAARLLPKVEVQWFERSAHDIHVDRPEELAFVMLEFIHRLS